MFRSLIYTDLASDSSLPTGLSQLGDIFFCTLGLTFLLSIILVVWAITERPKDRHKWYNHIAEKQAHAQRRGDKRHVWYGADELRRIEGGTGTLEDDDEQGLLDEVCEPGSAHLKRQKDEEDAIESIGSVQRSSYQSTVKGWNHAWS